MPYAYLDLYGNGTPVPLSLLPTDTGPKCYPYTADQVVADVDASHIDAFHDWVRTMSFEVATEYRYLASPSFGVTLRVPLGSVLDAIPVVQQAPGVVTAARNDWLMIPEAPPLPICSGPSRPGQP